LSRVVEAASGDLLDAGATVEHRVAQQEEAGGGARGAPAAAGEHLDGAHQVAVVAGVVVEQGAEHGADHGLGAGRPGQGGVEPVEPVGHAKARAAVALKLAHARAPGEMPSWAAARAVISTTNTGVVSRVTRSGPPASTTPLTRAGTTFWALVWSGCSPCRVTSRGSTRT